MRRHPKALEEAGISQERYLELMWICRQYPGYVRRIRRVRAGIVDRPGRKSGAWKRPDPTGNAAASIADACAWMDARVKLIDDCARRAAPEAVAEGIVESVTLGRAYDRLRHRVPCGKNQFYDYRLGFFILLDDAMKNRG